MARAEQRMCNGEVASVVRTDTLQPRNGVAWLEQSKFVQRELQAREEQEHLYSQVSNMKDGEISNPILDEDQKGAKKFKLVTITNRINEHTADYAKDYVKIKDLALRENRRYF